MLLSSAELIDEYCLSPPERGNSVVGLDELRFFACDEATLPMLQRSFKLQAFVRVRPDMRACRRRGLSYAEYLLALAESKPPSATPDEARAGSKSRDYRNTPRRPS